MTTRAAVSVRENATESHFRPVMLCSVERWELAPFLPRFSQKATFCGRVNALGTRSTKREHARDFDPLPPSSPLRTPAYLHLLPGNWWHTRAAGAGTKDTKDTN